MKLTGFQKLSLVIIMLGLGSIGMVSYAEPRPTIPNQSGVPAPVNPALKSPNPPPNPVVPDGKVEIDTRNAKGNPTATVIDANGNLKIVSPNSPENNQQKPLPEGYSPGSVRMPPPPPSPTPAPPSPAGQSPVMNNIPGTSGGQPIINTPEGNRLLPDQIPPAGPQQPLGNPNSANNPNSVNMNQNNLRTEPPLPNEPPVGVPEQMPQGVQKDMTPKQIETPAQGAAPNIAPPTPTQSTLPMPAAPNRY